jgi:hypothetical protein
MTTLMRMANSATTDLVQKVPRRLAATRSSRPTMGRKIMHQCLTRERSETRFGLLPVRRLCATHNRWRRTAVCERLASPWVLLLVVEVPLIFNFRATGEKCHISHPCVNSTA